MEIEGLTIGMIELSQAVALNDLQKRMARGWNTKLTIDWGDFQKHNWSKIAQYITKVNAQELFICNNHYEPILRQLSHVNFPKLTKIVVRNNNITSLQALIKYDFAKLKELDLQSNFITDTKSIAKMNVPDLQILRLSANPTISNDQLYKCNFSQLREIQLSQRSDLLQKFNIFTDPVIWRIKLRPSLEKDRVQIRHRIHDYRRGYIRRQSVTTTLAYTKYTEMLGQKR